MIRRTMLIAAALALVTLGSPALAQSQVQKDHAQLQKEDVVHTWHEWAGGHDDAYWSSHLADYLRFYGDAFRAASSAS